jgi:hypothetical protein
MPHQSYPISPDGFALTVMVGLNGHDTAAYVASGRAIPAPRTVRAIIDSGSDMTCVAPGILRQLGLSSIGQASTQTMSGPLTADFFEVSLSIPRSGPLPGPLLLLEQLFVMELTQPLPNIDVLVGKDVLMQCLLISDGPRGMFTIGD